MQFSARLFHISLKSMFHTIESMHHNKRLESHKHLRPTQSQSIQRLIQSIFILIEN